MQAATARTIGLVIVCVGALFTTLDTAVNVAFPAMTHAFGLTLRDMQWVVISYVLAQSCLTILFGRLGDLYGYKRIFTLGMAACAAVHLAIGFVTDYGWLLTLRVLQGVSVGLVIACGPALATLLYPASEKRRILGLYVTATSLGMTLAPLAGGLLMAWVGWPGTFWFRTPLAILVLVLLPWVPDVRAAEENPSTRQQEGTNTFDWIGAALLALLLGSLLLFATQATRAEVAWGPTLALLAAWLISSALFVRHEQRAATPILRITPFASWRFSGIQLGSVVINVACFGIPLLVPYALEKQPGHSIVLAGTLLAFFPAGAVVGGLFASRSAQRLSSMTLVRAGLLIASAGLLLTAWVIADAARIPLAAAIALAGLGMGLFQGGYFDATTSLLAEHERGVAGSLTSVTRLLGIVLGATGISALQTRLGAFDATFLVLGAALLGYALVYAISARPTA